METFLKIWTYVFGATLILNAALGVLDNVLHGNIGWSIAWSLVLMATIETAIWARKLFRSLD